MRPSQLSQPHRFQLPTSLLFVGLGLFCRVFLLQDQTVTSITVHQIICHSFRHAEATTASCHRKSAAPSRGSCGPSPKPRIGELCWTPGDGDKVQTTWFPHFASASHGHERGRMGPQHAPGLQSRADEQREGKKGNYREVISQNKRTKPLRLPKNKNAVPIDFSDTTLLQQKHASANRGPV